MNYKFIKQLIELAEEFEAEYGVVDKQTLRNFVVWLNHKNGSSNTSLPEIGNQMRGRETIDSVIGKFIGYMNRYARMYTKAALKNSPLITLEDFTYLASLYTHGSMTKMELIEKNIHEKTSGMEVIKRLQKKGFIEQANDTADKRSKRVSITQTGREVIEQAFPQMGRVATVVTGNLTIEEKHQLIYLLNKLNNYHHPIYLKEREIGWDRQDE